MVSCLVHIFTGGPILIVLSEFLPAFVSEGEISSGKHCDGRNEEDGGSRYGIACPLRLLLGIFERVDVLGDDLHIQMVVLHLLLQRQHI